MLELTLAAFMFLLGLALAWFGVHIKSNPFVLAGGIIWLIAGVLALMGYVIYDQDYTFTNYTYSNLTVVYNATTNLTISNYPVVTGINETSHFVMLNNSGFYQLGTNGLYGWVLLLLGLGVIILTILAFLQQSPN